MDARIPDPRRWSAGHDERRVQWSPTDQARAEALVARHGGVLEIAPVGADRVALQWTDPSGQAVRVEATDPSEALGLVAQSVEMGATTYLH